MTKSRRQKIRNAEFAKTGSASYAPRKYSNLDIDNAIRMREKIRKMRALRKDVVIQPQDVRPGDTIQIRKVRPRKRRDRLYTKWRVQYDDYANGYVVLKQEGWYNEKYVAENKAYMEEHGVPILDVWNLSYVFAEYLLPRLKAFIQMKRYGVPNSVCNEYGDDIDKASDAWEKKLQEMYQGICLYINNEEGKALSCKLGMDASRELEARGLRLFKEHLYDLWE